MVVAIRRLAYYRRDDAKGHFAELSTPGVKPVVLMAVSGQIANQGDVIITAQQPARDLEAHSFSIESPGGTSDHYFTDGDGYD